MPRQAIGILGVAERSATAVGVHDVRTVRQLLDTPFHELYATQGVGRKKIRSLVDLLHAPCKSRCRPLPARSISANPTTTSPVAQRPEAARPVESDPTNISESTWLQWCATITTHGMGQEPLGRFAASLQELPRVIWSTPLAAYSDLSLADLRALKTYGEKRVNAVLEVFASVQAILAAIDSQPHLSVRVAPRFALAIEAWISRVLEEAEPIGKEEIRRNLLEPLVQQIRIDAGEDVASLTKTRLTVGNGEANIRQIAGQRGLTRARIYQLFDDVQTIVRVRWPAGSSWVGRLQDRLDRLDSPRSATRLLAACAGVFFPATHRSLSRGIFQHPLAVRLVAAVQAELNCQSPGRQVLAQRRSGVAATDENRSRGLRLG